VLRVPPPSAPPDRRLHRDRRQHRDPRQAGRCAPRSGGQPAAGRQPAGGGRATGRDVVPATGGGSRPARGPGRRRAARRRPSTCGSPSCAGPRRSSCQRRCQGGRAARPRRPADAHPRPRDRQARDLLAGAVTVGRKYLFDEAHARHVAELALTLYDQLRPLHNLGSADGSCCRPQPCCRTSASSSATRAITSTLLPDLEHRAAELQSARDAAGGDRRPLSRGADPTAVHHPFAELSEDEQQRVVRLIALLRVAHALDRDHLQRVRDLQVRIGNSWVTLHLEASGGLLLEGGRSRRSPAVRRRVFQEGPAAVRRRRGRRACRSFVKGPP